MSRNLTSAGRTAVTGEVVARTAAVQLDFPTAPVRANGSPQSIFIGGNEFLGIGGLGAISVTEEGAELRAYNLTVGLTGVPRDAIAATMTEAYQGRRATVWEVLLDPVTGQPLTDPIVVFRGRMDQMDVQLGETATVTVRLVNRLTDWERPRISRYTTEDQKRRHPEDQGFDFVSTTTEKEIVWPARSFTGTPASTDPLGQ